MGLHFDVEQKEESVVVEVPKIQNLSMIIEETELIESTQSTPSQSAKKSRRRRRRRRSKSTSVSSTPASEQREESDSPFHFPALREEQLEDKHDFDTDNPCRVWEQEMATVPGKKKQHRSRKAS